MDDKLKELLVRALIKKAKGCLVKERTDEYVVTDNRKVLVKSRVVSKRAPPDVAAIRALLQMNGEDIPITDMTDEQLNEEKMRLIHLLSDCQEE